jgi:hypothetical protein
MGLPSRPGAMAPPPSRGAFALGAVSLALAALGLVPGPYHRWWWWDLAMHAAAATVLAVWGHRLDLDGRVAWPALVGGMLAWEWLELSTRYLHSPTRGDVLSDLTVNVVVFGVVWVLLARRRDVDVALARPDVER